MLVFTTQRNDREQLRLYSHGATYLLQRWRLSRGYRCEASLVLSPSELVPLLRALSVAILDAAQVLGTFDREQLARAEVIEGVGRMGASAPEVEL